MLAGLTNALRGAGGEFEINRVVGAIGTLAYIVCANVFVAINFAKGQTFNVTEYCLAFPGGLAVCVGAIAGAVSLKDRNVAMAKVVSETGAVPAPPPSGPQVPVEPRNESNG
jgi:hypothetical protein